MGSDLDTLMRGMEQLALQDRHATYVSQHPEHAFVVAAANSVPELLGIIRVMRSELVAINNQESLSRAESIASVLVDRLGFDRTALKPVKFLS